jgi:hypothetical protein
MKKGKDRSFTLYLWSLLLLAVVDKSLVSGLLVVSVGGDIISGMDGASQLIWKIKKC